MSSHNLDPAEVQKIIERVEEIAKHLSALAVGQAAMVSEVKAMRAEISKMNYRLDNVAVAAMGR